MNAQTQQQDQGARDEKKERLAKVDFKMVTFALAGKDYGIDIMSVKEIAKAGRFTYVPNAAPFVRGVYNLRGEIISVIDLRTMFHLPAEKKTEESLESLLILQVADHVFGVIVDSIDKVIGIASDNIQPPHPIFGDINVKYIRGVVENLGRLYIILDIAKIFTQREDRKEESRPAERDRGLLSGAVDSHLAAADLAQASYEAGRSMDSGEMEFSFVKESLFALKRFGVTAVNEEWAEKRFAEWKAQHKGKDSQLKESDDAEAFLAGFFSPDTGAFWSEEHLEAAMACLPDISSKGISAWNPGCGRGYETYSFAVALKLRYPDARIKIWANDADLLNISMAPNLVVESNELPEAYQQFLVAGRNGHAFSAAIRDAVSFEYHDVLNSNPVPEVDFILCRDMVSFMSGAEQSRILGDFREKLKAGGTVFMGAHERMPAADGWEPVEGAAVSAYRLED